MVVDIASWQVGLCWHDHHPAGIPLETDPNINGAIMTTKRRR
jgi:hypothetical protein